MYYYLYNLCKIYFFIQKKFENYVYIWTFFGNFRKKKSSFHSKFSIVHFTFFKNMSIYGIFFLKNFEKIHLSIQNFQSFIFIFSKICLYLEIFFENFRKNLFFHSNFSNHSTWFLKKLCLYLEIFWFLYMADFDYVYIWT
jgi:hypothetical protein